MFVRATFRLKYVKQDSGRRLFARMFGLFVFYVWLLKTYKIWEGMY